MHLHLHDLTAEQNGKWHVCCNTDLFAAQKLDTSQRIFCCFALFQQQDQTNTLVQDKQHKRSLKGFYAEIFSRVGDDNIAVSEKS